MENWGLATRAHARLRLAGPRGISLCLILSAAGCGLIKPAAPDKVSTTGLEAPALQQPTIETPPQSSEHSPAPIEGATATPQTSIPAPAAPPGEASAPGPVKPPHGPPARPNAGDAQSSSAGRPAKSTPTPGGPAATKQPPAATGIPAASQPAAVPDLAALEQRLRDTGAIGVFTKLALKNQVDDLIQRFRSTYGAQTPVATPDLRQRYDLLLLKVVTLLQDGDPALARAISSSREALWAILSDPKKFANIQL